MPRSPRYRARRGGARARARASLLLLAGVLLLTGCNWIPLPGQEYTVPSAFTVGHVDDFERESVTTYLFHEREAGWQVIPSDLSTINPNRLRSNAIIVHLIRARGGWFSALYARDPHSGCWVHWEPDLQYQGQRGLFRDPCEGGLYNLHGHWVAGPSQHGLSRFPASVSYRSVNVNILRDLLLSGERRRHPPPE